MTWTDVYHLRILVDDVIFRHEYLIPPDRANDLEMKRIMDKLGKARCYLAMIPPMWVLRRLARP